MSLDSRQAKKVSLEADLSSRKPCELDRGCCDRLTSRHVDGRLPLLKGKVAVDFEIFADAFHHLKVYIVYRCSALNQTSCRGVDFAG